MAEFFFELVSPERLVFSGLVEHVVAPGTDGEFGVLAGHAPFVSTLKPGLLSIHASSDTKRMFVRGGVAEARPDGFTVLSEMVVPLEEFDAAQLAQEITNAEERRRRRHRRGDARQGAAAAAAADGSARRAACRNAARPLNLREFIGRITLAPSGERFRFATPPAAAMS